MLLYVFVTDVKVNSEPTSVVHIPRDLVKLVKTEVTIRRNDGLPYAQSSEDRVRNIKYPG